MPKGLTVILNVHIQIDTQYSTTNTEVLLITPVYKEVMTWKLLLYLINLLCAGSTKTNREAFKILEEYPALQDKYVALVRIIRKMKQLFLESN